MAYCIRRTHNFIQTPTFPLERRRNCYIFISIPTCLPMSPGNMFAPSATKKIKTFINFLYTPVLKNRNRCVPTTGSAPPRVPFANKFRLAHKKAIPFQRITVKGIFFSACECIFIVFCGFTAVLCFGRKSGWSKTDRLQSAPLLLSFHLPQLPFLKNLLLLLKFETNTR